MAGRRLAKSAQILAQAQQSGFGAMLIGHRIPFRPADGAEQHRIGFLRQLHRVVGDRHLMVVIGGAAGKIAIGLEADAVAGGTRR